MTSLTPTEHELRRARRLEIGAVVLLDSAASGPEPAPARAAADFAARCPTPWPAAWLPGATARAGRMAGPPAGVPVLRLPPRSDSDETALGAVTRLVAQATSDAAGSTASR